MHENKQQDLKKTLDSHNEKLNIPENNSRIVSMISRRVEFKSLFQTQEF